MARYIDSGAGLADQDVGHWLDANVVTGIREFRCQFGYFRYSAIESFADIIRDLAHAGGAVHFVLGSNFGSLIAADAQRVLRVTSGTHASLSVVAFANAEFHPKTVHIVRADRSVTAVVGSSNLTGRGLGQNVEAGVVFDTNDADSVDQLNSIRDAIDRWREQTSERDAHQMSQAVFPISCDDDLRELAELGIINVPQPRRFRAVNGGRPGNGSTLPNRLPTWRPTRQGWRPEIPDLIQAPPNTEDAHEEESDVSPELQAGVSNTSGTRESTGVTTKEVLLMRVRPRRDGTQLQISMTVHRAEFMNNAEFVISAASGIRRPIGYDYVTRNEERAANLARFEAPEMENMSNPVARFEWIEANDAEGHPGTVLQYEIFDADRGGEGAKIYEKLAEGISNPPVTNLQSLSRDLTVLSKSNRAIAQWYRLAVV
jgi:hypothetical protein